MERKETTIRDGVHDTGLLCFQSPVRTRMGRTENDTVREVQDWIDRLTASGDTRFKAVWMSGCVLDSREKGQHRVFIFNHKRRRGIRK